MINDSGLAPSAAPEVWPNERGYFGAYGGRFVPETLIAPLQALTEAWNHYRTDAAFLAEFSHHLRHYVGRPSPLYHAERLSQGAQKGAQIWLKREDLNHTGAHKINNTVGQAMLAQRMNKTRLVAETGAGQHGVATATVAARFAMQCMVYMGSVDIERQASNVHRMRLLGAEVVPVQAGSQTLKDALNEAMRDWVSCIDDTFYVIGSAAGPHPYPLLVRDLQTVIGRETREQCQELFQGLPDALVACVGGGSNAIGLFHPFIDDQQVRMYGVEAGGTGADSGQHAASLGHGRPGVLHGSRSYLLEDDAGQIVDTHSVSAGLDYPGVGPEHAWLKDSGRADYVMVSDAEALEAFHLTCRTEGIVPALESCHALAWAWQLARTMRPEQHIVVNLSGRGDKDIGSVSRQSS